MFIFFLTPPFVLCIIVVTLYASMAELVDAADSKSALSNKVLVQVRLEVPKLFR